MHRRLKDKFIFLESPNIQHDSHTDSFVNKVQGNMKQHTENAISSQRSAKQLCSDRRGWWTEKEGMGWDRTGKGRSHYISELISVHCLSDMWDASESMMSNSSGWLSDRRLGSLDTFREGRRTKNKR